jgi:inner membrane protein
MTGQTHVAIGIATILTISFDQPLENQLILVLASTIGSLVPDLDHPKSKLNQKLLLFNNNFYQALFYLSLSAIFIYLYLIKNSKPFILLGIMSFLIGISSHRSFTHSIVGFLISASIVKMGTLKYGLSSIHSGFTTGYALHLIADFFTPKGIKLFYPINVNVASPITIKTNSKLEKIIFMLLSIYSICLLLRYVK